MNMKTIALGTVMLSLLAAWLVPDLTTAQDTADHKVKWFSYEEGLALAEAQRKPLVIYFYAEWCAYCVRMENETYADPKVIDFLNNKVIAAKVDTDHEREVARAYAVRGLPATFMRLPGGSQFGPIRGFIPPRSYLAMLTKILEQS